MSPRLAASASPLLRQSRLPDALSEKLAAAKSRELSSHPSPELDGMPHTRAPAIGAALEAANEAFRHEPRVADVEESQLINDIRKGRSVRNVA